MDATSVSSSSSQDTVLMATLSLIGFYQSAPIESLEQLYMYIWHLFSLL